MANNMANVQQSRPQLHISSNPDDSIDELFKVASHHHHPYSVPMIQRKLPPSFFRPPSASSSAAHSRESSLDATFVPKHNSAGKPPTPMGSANSPASPPTLAQVKQQHLLSTKTTPPPPHSGLAIHHARARSSPALLQPSNFSLPNSNIQANIPQPQSQQHPPRLQPLSPQVTAIQQQNFHGRQHSYDLNNLQLPDGWEMRKTPNGEQYFINHREKSTTWEDPRREVLMRELQNTNPNSISQIAQVRQVPNTFSSQPNVQQVMQAQRFAESRTDAATLPLPDGWEQTNTPNGDLFYVNHNEQTTTWFHPSLARQLQLKTVQLKQQSSGVTPPSFLYATQQHSSSTSLATSPSGNIPPELVAALENMNTSGHPAEQQASTDIMRQLQNSHVRDLELECERMRQRQEEIRKYLPFNNQNSDPFLSSTAVDAGTPHGRQESIDSGLSLASVSSGMNDNHLNNALNGTFAGEQMISGNLHNGNQINSVNFSPEDLMDQMAGNQQRINANHNGLNNAHHTMAGANHTDDLSFIDSIDLMPSNFDMDMTLTDVEELLNSNRDNLMWL